MATKLFLRDDAVNAEVTVGTGTKKLLSTVQGAALVASDATATVAGPTTGVQVKKAGVVLIWISAPLAAVTISGTITFNLWGKESNLAANCGFDVLVERVNRVGTVQSTILRSEHGTEFGTAAAAENWTGTPTSTALVDTDRIKVTVFANDAGGNMASGQTFTLDYGAATGVDGDSYVQFNEALSIFDAHVTSVGGQTAINRTTVPGNARITSVGGQTAINRTTVPGNARITSVGAQVAVLRNVNPPGSARITSVGAQVPIVRTDVPGAALATSVGAQVAVLRNVDPPGNARITSVGAQVAILRTSASQIIINTFIIE